MHSIIKSFSFTYISTGFLCNVKKVYLITYPALILLAKFKHFYLLKKTYCVTVISFDGYSICLTYIYFYYERILIISI